jgi:hypothetical protein
VLRNYKVIQPFQAVIEESAFQVYSSASAFAPSTTRILQRYRDAFKDSTPNVLRGRWSLQPQSISLAGHTAWVGAIAFSPGGRRIILGRKTIQFECGMEKREPLWGNHTRAILGLFSASRCPQMAAELPWSHQIIRSDCRNGETGAALGEPTSDHTGKIRCLAFSQDDHRIASGSVDHSYVLCLAFSPAWRTIRSICRMQRPVPLWVSHSRDTLVGFVAWLFCQMAARSSQAQRTIRSDCGMQSLAHGASVGEPIKDHTEWIQSIVAFYFIHSHI